MRRNKGFSLIELLMVVAVILVIAAIAIPNLIHSRIASNESTAAASIRTVNSSQVSYTTSYATVGYASTLTALGGTCTSTTPTTSSACLIDGVLASGSKNGYAYVISNMSGTPATGYNIIAGPISPNYSGIRYFCSFEDGVIRFSQTTIATCDTTVTPLQ